MNLTQPTERPGTRGYAHLVELRVPVARVWSALTDPRLMRIWSGKEAEIDARKNGLYRLGRSGHGGRDAHIDVIEENRRLRLIYLPDPGLPPTDGVLIDDFLLDVRPDERMVALRLLGSGIPEVEEWDRAYLRIRAGWERQLARLKSTLEHPPGRKPKLVSASKALRDLDY
ncbi:MAG: SRPBCC domain-containing protein [Steroidobacterales bacterium]